MARDYKLERLVKKPSVRSGLRTAGLSLLAAGLMAGPQALSGKQETAAPTAASTQVAPLREPTLRLLTQSQYQNAIATAFGADIAVKARFAPVQRVDGLVSVGASKAVMTGGSIDPLDASARGIAEQIIAPERRDFLFPCRPANVRAADANCARKFFETSGRLIYRRPLTVAELDGLTAMAGKAVGAGGDFYGGISFAISSMLVSPQFLYIWEHSEPDPTNPDSWRLDGYSKASRLSFLLWNSIPDQQLLDAAASGALHRPDGLRRQVERMISSPKYQQGVRAFFDDFLVNELFENLSKDTQFYPAMTIKAIGESREQLLRTIVDHLVARRGDYRDLFTTRKTFMSSDLAVLYRLPIETGSQGWVPYEFPAGDPRAGIQSQIGFLAKYSHPARSSATRRGRAIREVLMCQPVPDPPPNVDFTGFEDPAGEFRTARDRLNAHNANPVCAGCHKITDPIGLALENFDGAGQFRHTDGSVKIDPSGSLDGIDYTDPAGLGGALRDNASIKSCIVNRMYAYSIGQEIRPHEESLLETYETALNKRGFRFDEMLRMVIMDRSFFAVRPLVETRTAMNSTKINAPNGGYNAH